VTKTTLRAKLAYALFEETTGHSAHGTGIATGQGRHRIIVGYIVSSCHMSIPTVISLSTCAILEISKTKILITIVQETLERLRY